MYFALPACKAWPVTGFFSVTEIGTLLIGDTAGIAARAQIKTSFKFIFYRNIATKHTF